MTQPKTLLQLVASLAVVTAAVVGVASPTEAATGEVAIRDNLFSPQEIHIKPGETVVWAHNGTRTHSVTSDEKLFNSGPLTRGDMFSSTFEKKGSFYYHCRFHGAKGQVGQWGLVVVGKPPEPDVDEKPRFVVPDDFPTIQSAVDAATPGSEVVIKAGIYRESVTVATPELDIRGVDRFRTVLNGEDIKTNGVEVRGVDGVRIKNLTVRNYTGSGILFEDATDYVVSRVDSIKNRTFGINVVSSFDGAIKNSFAWGSGDSGFRIADCFGCSTTLDNIHAEMNFVGSSSTNATGVLIRNSTFVHNGAGIMIETDVTHAVPASQAALIYSNTIEGNNVSTVPTPPGTDPEGIPFGTGIWLLAARNATITNNTLADHDRYGVLVTQSLDQQATPENNRVADNFVRGSGRYELAWDGAGSDNCFSGNDVAGSTGPPDLQTAYTCDQRPFEGQPFAPVSEDVAAAAASGPNREQEEPPEPTRPPCQEGRKGCTP